MARKVRTEEVAKKERRAQIATILCAVVVFGSLPALAGPTVDGRFAPGEGYTTGNYLNFEVEDVGLVAPQGQLWMHQGPDSSLYVAFIQPVALVDNSYGANSIGWESSAPSGRNHSFRDLKGSDDATFRINFGSGHEFVFTLDYIEETSRGSGVYASEEREPRGEYDPSGTYDTYQSYVTEFGTSLDYNFNTLGYVLTEDSPLADDDYSNVDPAYAGWLFEVSYEFKIDGNLFDTYGAFAGLDIIVVHDSPNKLGRNKVYPETDGPIDPIPAPGALVLAGIGVGLTGRLRRRNFSI